MSKSRRIHPSNILFGLIAMAHWLDRLLNPHTIAIVGASERAGNLGASTQRQLQYCGYPGRIYAVNPKYPSLYADTCYASLQDLPVVPDLVIYAISGLPLEQSFEQALALRVGGIVIYAANTIENDSEPRLTERLRRRARKAGIPVCGGNSMGFYNYDDNVMVSFDRPPAGRLAGHIGLVTHSGSGMTYLANNDARFRFNYVIASGQEINASAGDYLDYLLAQPSTRVIAVLLETVRDVPAFVAALKKARAQSIPVVITRLGCTEQSAQLAVSHSGAIVGNHEALVALCERHGAILCRDADEMMLSALLFASGKRVRSGGLASMLDSGGMREQMVDLAEHYGIPFAQISANTTAVLRQNLEAGLDAVNPMDGMGALGKGSARTFLECGKALLDDADCGLLTFEFEFRDDFSHYPELFEVTRQLDACSDKPVALINSCSFASITRCAAEFSERGIPVLNGIDLALRALRNLMRFRAAAESEALVAPIEFDAVSLAAWSRRLAGQAVCDEITSLQLMSDFGLPSVHFELAQDLPQVLAAAGVCGYPLVLKTAMPGIAHKSERDGVRVGIEDDAQLETAYRDLQQRLGEQVLLMPQVAAGIEVSVGMKNDAQFGPMVIIACGGVLIELLSERAFALAPLTPAEVDAMIDRTRLAKLLAGVRGRPAVDRTALVELVVRFSELVIALADDIVEIDLNPVIVGQSGCTIVDALVVPASTGLS
jgi:acyl-CoA synthetase (NDP forming)